MLSARRERRVITYAQTIGLVTVHNRIDATLQSIPSIFSATSEPVSLFVFDDASDEDRDQLLSFMQDIRECGAGVTLIHQPQVQHDRAGWGKSYAIRAVLGLLSLTCAPQRHEFFLMDNDVVLRPGWLEFCRAALKAGSEVASAFDDVDTATDRLYTTGRITHKKFQGSAFWFARLERWLSWTLPPFGTLAGDRDDVWIGRQWAASNFRIAVPHGEQQYAELIKVSSTRERGRKYR